MRSFFDETGTEWIVWAVHPQHESARHVERRLSGDRRVSAAPDPIIERRAAAGRRQDAREAARSIRMHHPEGWLTFQAGVARRRLHPIPTGWETGDDAALRALLDSAVPARPAVRSVEIQADDAERRR